MRTSLRKMIVKRLRIMKTDEETDCTDDWFSGPAIMMAIMMMKLILTMSLMVMMVMITSDISVSSQPALLLCPIDGLIPLGFSCFSASDNCRYLDSVGKFLRGATSRRRLVTMESFPVRTCCFPQEEFGASEMREAWTDYLSSSATLTSTGKRRIRWLCSYLKLCKAPLLLADSALYRGLSISRG